MFEINDSSLWKSSQGDSVCQCVQVRETYSQTISFRTYLVEQEEWLDSGKQRKKETLLISVSSKQKVIKMEKAEGHISILHDMIWPTFPSLFLLLQMGTVIK